MSSLTVRQLQVRIDQKRAEAQTMLDGSADGTLSDEQQAAWDALMQDLDRLKQAMTNRAALDELDRRSAGAPLAPTTGDPRLDREASRVSILDAIRAMLPHEMRSELTREQLAGIDRARTVSDELARRNGRPAKGIYWRMDLSGAPEQRVLSTFGPVGGPGSNLIPTLLAPSVEDRLRQKVLVRKMGATVLGGMTGNFAIPRLNTSAQAQWIPEGGTITATDPAFDQILFTPKHCGGIVSISRNMIQQPSYDVATLVENDLAKVLAVALDQAALTGSGNNDPLGLLTSGSGITIVSGGTNGSAPTWGNIVTLIKSVDQSNALDGSLGFITNARAVAAMRTTPKVSSDTIGNFIMNEPDELAGYPLGSTQNMPNTYTKGSGTGLSGLVFGDWSQLVLAFWSELDILLNPYDPTAYASGGLLIRAMMTANVNTRHPQAFAALTDVIAA